MGVGAGSLITANVRLVAPLASGGMGTLWTADHLGLHSRVVVKMMSPSLVSSEESRQRFSREAAAAALVRSPHTVQVFDHGISDDGIPYIVMEYLEGEDLERHLSRRGRLTLGEVAVIVAQVGKALARAHERGVTHRDIKPQNVFLRDVGGGEIFAMVLDFGIAKTRDQLLSKLTQTGVMMGTPYYMSPEQLILNAAVDEQADLWSLAVVAFEMITGQLPFPGATPAVVGMAMMAPGRPVPSALMAGVPRAVDAWFERAFAQQPRDRFANAREMASAFLEASRTRLSSPPAAIEESRPPPRSANGVATAAMDLHERAPLVARQVEALPAVGPGETRAFERSSSPASGVQTRAWDAPSYPGTRPIDTTPIDIPLPGILKRPMPPSPDLLAPTRRLLPVATQRRMRVDVPEREVEVVARPAATLVEERIDDTPPLRPQRNMIIALILVSALVVLLVLTATR